MTSLLGPLRAVLLTLPVAFGLWFLTFAVPVGNFWIKLCLSASILAVTGVMLRRSEQDALFCFKRRHLWIGPVSALVLYGIFWLGNQVSSILFLFASKEISIIYLNKTQLPLAVIGLLLVFVMGPAEEIYWHGFIQRSFSHRFGAAAGVLLTTAVYAVVHVVAFNFMLFVAAAICGLFWGVLYQREQSLIPVIISHSLWDLIIFVLFPLG
jgi:membrane protease YdiL (CAAX protease family)